MLPWHSSSSIPGTNYPLNTVLGPSRGSSRHCAEQLIRWLWQKKFIDPIGILLLASRMDFTLFGRVWREVEEERKKVEAEVVVKNDKSLT